MLAIGLQTDEDGGVGQVFGIFFQEYTLLLDLFLNPK